MVTVNDQRLDADKLAAEIASLRKALVKQTSVFEGGLLKNLGSKALEKFSNSKTASNVFGGTFGSIAKVVSGAAGFKGLESAIETAQENKSKEQEFIGFLKKFDKRLQGLDPKEQQKMAKTIYDEKVVLEKTLEQTKTLVDRATKMGLPAPKELLDKQDQIKNRLNVLVGEEAIVDKETKKTAKKVEEAAEIETEELATLKKIEQNTFVKSNNVQSLSSIQNDIDEKRNAGGYKQSELDYLKTQGITPRGKGMVKGSTYIGKDKVRELLKSAPGQSEDSEASIEAERSRQEQLKQLEEQSKLLQEIRDILQQDERSKKDGKGMFSSLLEMLGGGKLAGAVGGLARGAVGMLGRGASAVGGLIGRGASAVGGLLGRGAAAAGGLISRGAGAVASGAGSLLSKGAEVAGSAIKSVGGALKGTGTIIAEGASKGVGALSKAGTVVAEGASKGVGALSKAGTVVAEGASKVGGLVAEGASKGAGALSKVGGVLAKGAKFIPGVGLAVTAGMAGYDAISAASNAEETLGIKGREASTGEKIAAGAGGVVEGLTFGLADKKTVGNALVSAGSSIKGALGFGDKPVDQKAVNDWAYSVHIGKATMEQVPASLKVGVGEKLKNVPANWGVKGSALVASAATTSAGAAGLTKPSVEKTGAAVATDIRETSAKYADDKQRASVPVIPPPIVNNVVQGGGGGSSGGSSIPVMATPVRNQESSFLDFVNRRFYPR